MLSPNCDLPLPSCVKEDVCLLKLTKQQLSEHYSNLIFLKREFVLLNDSLIGHPIINAIKKCTALIHSVETQLLNYSTYFSLLRTTKNSAFYEDLLLQLESLQQFSDCLYQETQAYQDQLDQISLETFYAA